ncbi:unnamed protein product [Rhizophagus irregularis]|nr:unnamed protein product [Rhizophagus irregularis]
MGNSGIKKIVVTTAKSSERGLFKRAIFPPISPTIPIPTPTTSLPPTPPTPPAPPAPPTPPAPPAPPPPIPTASTPTVTVTILSTSFLPAETTPPAPQTTEVPSTTVEVIKTVAPASNPTDSGSDSYYEGNGNSLIVEGIGIKMSIAAVFLNVFYVLFA